MVPFFSSHCVILFSVRLNLDSTSSVGSIELSFEFFLRII